MSRPTPENETDSRGQAAMETPALPPVVAHLSVVQLANGVLRHVRAIAAIVLVILVVIGLVTVATPRMYTATGAFVPIQDTDDGGGLVGALGLDNGVGVVAGGLDYYVVLLQSRAVLGAVAADTYVVRVGDQLRTGDLVALFELGRLGRQRAEQEAVRRLQQALSTTADPRTGIVRIYVRTRWAGLSQQLAAHLLTHLDLTAGQTGAQAATAEARFADEQVRQAQEGLQGAEAKLQSFLARNRRFSQSSPLGLEFARLQRDMSMRQQTYFAQYQAWMRASLDAARRTAALVVVEHPVVPPTRDPSRLWTNLAFGLVLGLTVGLSAAFIREFGRSPPFASVADVATAPELGTAISRPRQGPTGSERPHQA